MDLLKQPLDDLRDDLDLLNKEWRDIEGSPLSASQYYHFESDPPHFLFNLNCPDSLRRKLQWLLLNTFLASKADNNVIKINDLLSKAWFMGIRIG